MSSVIEKQEYAFLKENETLKGNICLLTIGGSRAYGTNIEGSDIDVRGIAVEPRRQILTGKKFEQVLDKKTDTVIYGFSKIVQLLTKCNPNVIELLGTKDYLYLNDIGKDLILNRNLFITKQAFYTFGGYARAQLSKLENKTFPDLSQGKQEEQILRSIQNASDSWAEKYGNFPEDAIRLMIDKSDRDDMDKEIFVDIKLSHYPLRDYKCMWSEMNNIVKDYAKIGRRNHEAELGNKINKHAMHLCRLMITGTELLETGEIVTFREKEHDFLMSIRNGDFSKDGKLNDKFFKIVDELEAKMQNAYENSTLPDKPNLQKIDDFLEKTYEKVLEQSREKETYIVEGQIKKLSKSELESCILSGKEIKLTPDNGIKEDPRTFKGLDR